MEFKLGTFIIEGDVYTVGEWDGIRDVALVLDNTARIVTYQTPSGNVYSVPRDHFNDSLIHKHNRDYFDWAMRIYDDQIR